MTTTFLFFGLPREIRDVVCKAYFVIIKRDIAEEVPANNPADYYRQIAQPTNKGHTCPWTWKQFVSIFLTNKQFNEEANRVFYKYFVATLPLSFNDNSLRTFRPIREKHNLTVLTGKITVNAIRSRAVAWKLFTKTAEDLNVTSTPTGFHAFNAVSKYCRERLERGEAPDTEHIVRRDDWALTIVLPTALTMARGGGYEMTIRGDIRRTECLWEGV
ncbi:hypothetical protein EJ08DRAFT_701055 [Tothia fuscella]|uniref:Uncharacterized protein n=1 Tax=Tothia fuscella TaxID=1048955 RepID=A0A9P4NJ60_9PEZI|nr:hypothetical protein EJ08DRAFT_701055 [Tothia fuscella]